MKLTHDDYMREIYVLDLCHAKCWKYRAGVTKQREREVAGRGLMASLRILRLD